MASNEQLIWNFLKEKGLNDYGAAGVIGNIYAESGLNPKNLENYYESKLGYTDESYTNAVDNGIYTGFVTDSAGYGLCQWTYWSRKQALLAFAKSKGVSVGDLNMQMAFLWKELSDGYPSLVSTLTNASSISEAASAFMLAFERPADQSASAQKKRAEYSQRFYDSLHNSSLGTGEKKGGNAMLKVIEVALNEVGYLEKSRSAYNANPLVVYEKTAGAGYDNYTKYAYDIDKISGWYNGKKNGYAWCNVFVDWCMIQAYGVSRANELINHGQLGASVGWSAEYYKDMNRLYFKNPQPGDQVYFGSDYDNLLHTGLIYDVDDNYIYTIEGNTSSEAGVIGNGGGVFKKRYSRYDNAVCCFGRPLYSQSEMEDDEDMTLERFKELMKEYRAELQDNDAGAWSKADRDWAIEHGLITGMGNGPDGKPIYAWADFLTREQAAALFHRLAKYLGKEQ